MFDTTDGKVTFLFGSRYDKTTESQKRQDMDLTKRGQKMNKPSSYNFSLVEKSIRKRLLEQISLEFNNIIE